MQKRYEQACPIARTLDLVGDRWTLLIIRDLFLGCRRFNELLANSPGLPPKLLSQRLKYLIEIGFVAREIYSEYPPRSEYVLTERGRSLFPVLKTIGDWGIEHLYEGEDEVRDEVVAAITERVPEFTVDVRKKQRKTAKPPRRGGSRTAHTMPRKSRSSH